MKVLKFNLVFIPLVAGSLGAVAYSAYTLLHENARQQITQNARIMMETAASSRVYTTKQVQPLLQHKNFKLQTAIEDFKKGLDDLARESGAVLVPDALNTPAKTEPAKAVQETPVAPPKETSATMTAEPVAAAAIVAAEPAPADAGVKTPAEAQSKESETPAVAANSAATASKPPAETPAKKPAGGFWKNLFGSKEEPRPAAKETPTPSPAAVVRPAAKDVATSSVGDNRATASNDPYSAKPKETSASPAKIAEAPVGAAASREPVSTSGGANHAPITSAVPAAGSDTAAASAKEGFLLGRQRVIDEQKKHIDSLRSKQDEKFDLEFHPQSVPAYAATEIFNILRQKYPDYFYKEATLNPTNLRNRTSDWEADVVNNFRANPELTEFIGTRSTPAGDSLFLARPLKVTNISCLTCHSTPDKAPPEMLRQYGSANGFGWKMNEIIGAQVVTVPTSVSLEMAGTAWKSLTRWLVGAFAGIMVAGNLGFWILAGRDKPEDFQDGEIDDQQEDDKPQ